VIVEVEVVGGVADDGGESVDVEVVFVVVYYPSVVCDDRGTRGRQDRQTVVHLILLQHFQFLGMSSYAFFEGGISPLVPIPATDDNEEGDE